MMKGQISCDIRIGQYRFTNVANVQIKSSWEQITDVATITIQRKLTFQGVEITGDSGIFKRGDVVEISLGYDFNNNLVFSGYLVDIKPGSPLEIRCENEMFQLKRGAIKKTLPATNLASLLSYITPGYQVKAVDAELGDFRIVNETPAQVLDRLSRVYSMRSWFRGKTLYVGLAYWPELQQNPPPVFTFQKDIIEHDLVYQDAESVPLKVKAISRMPNDTTIEVELGDPEGQQRTLTYYNMSEKDLRETATRDLAQFRFAGFRGTFKTFGTPVVRHGDKIELIDPYIPDRNGMYIVKAVDTSFGLAGYKQVLELDAKV